MEALNQMIREWSDMELWLMTETTLHDLMADRQGRKVWRWLGRYRKLLMRLCRFYGRSTYDL